MPASSHTHAQHACTGNEIALMQCKRVRKNATDKREGKSVVACYSTIHVKSVKVLGLSWFVCTLYFFSFSNEIILSWRTLEKKRHLLTANAQWHSRMTERTHLSTIVLHAIQVKWKWMNEWMDGYNIYCDQIPNTRAFRLFSLLKVSKGIGRIPSQKTAHNVVKIHRHTQIIFDNNICWF